MPRQQNRPGVALHAHPQLREHRRRRFWEPRAPRVEGDFTVAETDGNKGQVERYCKARI